MADAGDADCPGWGKARNFLRRISQTYRIPGVNIEDAKVVPYQSSRRFAAESFAQVDRGRVEHAAFHGYLHALEVTRVSLEIDHRCRLFRSEARLRSRADGVKF